MCSKAETNLVEIEIRRRNTIWRDVSWSPSIRTALPLILVLVKSRQSRERTVESRLQGSSTWLTGSAVYGIWEGQQNASWRQRSSMGVPKSGFLLLVPRDAGDQSCQNLACMATVVADSSCVKSLAGYATGNCVNDAGYHLTIARTPAG
jgi:hypothetical protein